MQTRAKALDVVKHLKENRHCGRCEIATIGTGTIYNCFFHKHHQKVTEISDFLSSTIEDGKLVGDSDAGDFWNLFGGYAPIPRDVQDTVMTELMTTSSKKLFW